MYYHIVVETKEETRKKGKFQKIYRYDNNSLERIVSEVLIPFRRKEKVTLNWKTLTGNEIRSISVKETEVPIGTLTHIRQRNTPRDSKKIWNNEMVIENDGMARDITSEILQAMI